MLNTDTAYLGILGNPLGHSHSPLMHNAVFKQLGVNALYLPFELVAGQLGKAILGLQALGFRGVNVTIPFKEAVIPFLDDLSPEAYFYQAVNVVAFEGEKIIGYNTDGPGFILALQETGVSNWDHCLLLGAGGAAHSISLALAQNGAREMTILDIDETKASNLAEYISQNTSVICQAKLSNSANWAQSSGQADLIVNCTPMGMHPKAGVSPVGSWEEVSDQAIVCDIVYNPVETRFLAMAKQRGLTTVNGLAMFVYQGALTLKILLGIDAPVEFMKEVVGSELRSSGSNLN